MKSKASNVAKKKEPAFVQVIAIKYYAISSFQIMGPKSSSKYLCSAEKICKEPSGM